MIYHSCPWSAMMYHAPIQLGNALSENSTDLEPFFQLLFSSISLHTSPIFLISQIKISQLSNTLILKTIKTVGVVLARNSCKNVTLAVGHWALAFSRAFQRLNCPKFSGIREVTKCCTRPSSHNNQSLSIHMVFKLMNHSTVMQCAQVGSYASLSVCPSVTG